MARQVGKPRTRYALMDITTPGSGLFRIAEKGRPKLEATQVSVLHDGVEITYTSAFRLGADDWKLLVAIAGLAGIDKDPFQGPGSGDPHQLTLWDHFLSHGEASKRTALRLRTTAYALLREIGLADSGQNRRNLSASLERLANVIQTFRRDQKVMSGAHLLGYAHDEESGELVIGLSPQMARTILGESRQYVRISLVELRKLGPLASLLQAYFSARIRPGTSSSFRLDDLVEITYGPETVAPSTLRKRRERVREALLSFAGWTTWQISLNTSRTPRGRPYWTVNVHRVSPQDLERWELEMAAEMAAQLVASSLPSEGE